MNKYKVHQRIVLFFSFFFSYNFFPSSIYRYIVGVLFSWLITIGGQENKEQIYINFQRTIKIKHIEAKVVYMQEGGFCYFPPKKRAKKEKGNEKL